MGYIPVNNAKSLKSIVCRKFSGLNRKDYATWGEFEDTENISSDNYPYLSPQKEAVAASEYALLKNGEEAENIRAVIAPLEESDVTGFCGVIGTKFYYDGDEKELYQPTVTDDGGNYLYGMKIPSDGKIQLLWVNKVILIHGYDSIEVNPFVYYYDTTVENGSSKDCVCSYEYAHKGYYGEVVNGENGSIKVTFSVEKAEGIKPEAYDFKVGDTVFIDGIMTYSDSRWGTKSKLDAVSGVVSSYTEEQGGFAYGIRTWNITIGIELKNYLGEAPDVEFYPRKVYHIYKKIPYMTHLTLHKGRLWGASPNGEYVYASALNDVFDFNRFDGLSDDSVYIESSTEGGHIGAISCGSCVAVFKKNSFGAIYGELPEEFSVGKSYGDIGCSDINSCVVINNSLYFLGTRGFYEWTGSTPKLISEKLNKKYISAVGVTDGIKYFVSAYDGEIYENYAYDTRYNLWHKENEQPVTAAVKRDGRIYFASQGKLYKREESGEQSEWSVKSAKIFYEDFDMNRVNEMWIYLKSDSGGEAEVFSSSDGGEERSEGKITFEKTSGRTFRIPIRLKEGMYWQYRLRGKGNAVIFGIKIVYETNGRIYSNERTGYANENNRSD